MHSTVLDTDLDERRRSGNEMGGGLDHAIEDVLRRRNDGRRLRLKGRKGPACRGLVIARSAVSISIDIMGKYKTVPQRNTS